MNMRDTELQNSVKDILAREWQIPTSDIPDDAELNRHASWDSLGHIRLMLALQAELGIDLNEETIQSLSSIPRIVKHLMDRASMGAPAS